MPQSDTGDESDEREHGSKTLDVLVLAIPVHSSVVDLAVPATTVREVVRVDRITPFPGSPSDVGGVIAVRGQTVLVLDVAPHVRQSLADARLPSGEPVVLITHANRTLALRGGTPVRLGAAASIATSHGPPASLTLWSGRALPLAGTVRLADASRSDAADGSVLPLLDVAALLADVIDSSEGGT